MNRHERRRAAKQLKASTKLKSTEGAMLKLEPGDKYIIEWFHWDRQMYRVEEIRGDIIVSRRWIAHKQKWTDWPVVQNAPQLPWSRIKRSN